jgi:hypothetical protein
LRGFRHLSPRIGAILLSGGSPQNTNMLPCARHTVQRTLATILTQRSAD